MDVLQNFGLFLGRVSGCTWTDGYAPQKMDIIIEGYVLRILAFLPFSFSQKFSYFVLWYFLVQPRFQANIPSNLLRAASKFGQSWHGYKELDINNKTEKRKVTWGFPIFRTDKPSFLNPLKKDGLSVGISRNPKSLFSLLFCY